MMLPVCLIWILASAAVTGTAAALGVRWGLFRAVTNFAGRPVSVAGLAVVLGTAAGLAAGLALGAPWRSAGAGLVAALGFGLFGAIDDAWGDRSASGFGGHLRAAARGRFTTGFLKIVGGGLTALAAAWLLASPSSPGSALAWLLRGASVALAANAVNLLDTRPVRAAATSLVLMLSTLALGGASLPALAGAASAAAWLPWDRSRRAMLGDAGSNALGGVWGVAAVAAAPIWAAALLLAALIAFHLWTEGHSVNAFLAAHPRLDALDRRLRGE